MHKKQDAKVGEQEINVPATTPGVCALKDSPYRILRVCFIVSFVS